MSVVHKAGRWSRSKLRKRVLDTWAGFVYESERMTASLQVRDQLGYVLGVALRWQRTYWLSLLSPTHNRRCSSVLGMSIQVQLSTQGRMPCD